MNRQGDVAWASLPRPVGSGPGGRRPVMVVQGEAFNASDLATVLVATLTTNLHLEASPGNILIAASDSGLPQDSVVNVSALLTVDRRLLDVPVGRVGREDVERVLAGIDVVLGRPPVRYSDR